MKPSHAAFIGWSNTVLLLAVLTVLLMILRRLPPTIQEMTSAKSPETRRALHMRQPIMTIEAREPIDVNVTGGAVEVEPGSSPLPVTIER
jgi:hypothetical protein